MRVNPQLDSDGCLDIELIENSVAWQKEEGGDNILLQYINGGENMRIIERFEEDTNIVEAHYHAKSLMIKFADGSKKAYYKDAKGNYQNLEDYSAGKEMDKKSKSLVGYQAFQAFLGAER